MKSFLLIPLIGILSITSCVSVATVDSLSVESLLPADISFAPSVKNIAVIDNTVPADIPKHQAVTVETTLPANGAVLTDKLATSIADANYFDKVVITSSKAGNLNSETRVLPPDTVKRICRELGVDMLLTVDWAGIETKSVHLYDSYEDGERFAGVSGAVKVQTRIYLPGRDKPFQNFVDCDTLYWDLYGLTDKTVINESSEYMGTMPMKHVTPYWDEEDRYYFSGGTVNMRDGAVSLRENDWELAYESWMLDYKNGKGKKKMRAAYNIGLYYEMQGDLQSAIKYVKEARELAFAGARTNANEDEVSVRLPNEWAFIDRYLDALQQKELLLQKLDLQMGRFNE